MTGTEFSTAVDEINGGDPIASTLRFQFGNLDKNLIEEAAVDDPPQDGDFQGCSHFKHVANLDRSFDHQRL
jgi:hypothetical protein